jgi:hypothetical protein
MLLCELFDSGNKMEERLRQAALEVITPYLAQGLPFVTMQQMITALRPHSGIDITRGLLMKILDPNKTKAVDKIEGDHIVLAKPDEDEQTAEDDAAAAQEQQQQSEDHVNDMAQKVAKDAMK